MNKSYTCALFLFFITLAHSADKPKWINSPLDYCGSQKLCAVGEATGRIMAETEARNSLAKIFETKIQATTTAITTAESQTKDDVVTGTVDEEYRSQIKEITEQTLEGVEVIEFYEDGDSYYALASLNKVKAAGLLKSKMEAIDEEITGLYKMDKRVTLNKAISMFVVRDNLNHKYNFLTGQNYSPRISKLQLMQAKKKKQGQVVPVLLEVDEMSETNELRDVVINNLLANDFRVVTASTLKYQYKVSVTLTGEKQHMNVKGFEKYKFLLSIVSKNLEGQKLGSLNFDEVATGRNLTQAYSNVLDKIKTYISNNMDQLNIE